MMEGLEKYSYLELISFSLAQEVLLNFLQISNMTVAITNINCKTHPQSSLKNSRFRLPFTAKRCTGDEVDKV